MSRSSRSRSSRSRSRRRRSSEGRDSHWYCHSATTATAAHCYDSRLHGSRGVVEAVALEEVLAGGEVQ